MRVRGLWSVPSRARDRQRRLLQERKTSKIHLASVTRRMFLAGAAALTGRAQSQTAKALDPNTLEKFVDPLPIPLVAKGAGKANHYRLEMSEIAMKVHRDLP